MAADEQQEKWYFTKEQLANTPSQKCGYDADKELSCRQQAANFIQDMGQRLQVTQLCINTAIVYMHRFYMFHSFSRFHRTAIAAAALFLAAKVEEQPRKLEHVIKVAQICLHREQPPPDTKSEIYMEQAQELVVNENILLQTLGFDVAIDHPHTHVVRCCHLVRASKDLAQTSYFMASNSLHLTTMCLQYKPTVVACFCIHLACKWSDWEIPQSNEGKPWFWYVDKTVSQELLEQLTEEFLVIFDKCPSRLKKKIMSLSSSQNQTILSAFGREDKKRNGEGSSASMAGGSSSGLSVEDMKKKQEFQRHHADYKKHHISHRSDSHSMPGKSSCLFGPPQKTQPPSASSHVSQSRLLAKPSLPPQPQLPPAPHQQQQQSSQSDITGISKPDHLHHRPRRPDDKHVRNHESLRDPYKKYENKLTGAILSDFSQTSSNGGSVSTKSVVSNNNNNNSSSSGVALSSASGFPVEPLPSSVQHGGLTEPVTVKNELIVAPAALAMSKVLQQSVAPHSKPKTPPSVQQPPPPVKTERSIFSPEKSTPPSAESRPQVIPPLTGMKRKRSTSSETDMLLLPIKVEPPSHYDVVSQETLVPKEEKPPDQSTSVEQLQFSSTSPALTEQANHPFQQPFLPQQSDQPLTLNEESHTKEQKKKKKRHRDHKEKHKDKHKHKHRNRDPEPIVITIPKEKLTLPQQPEQGLKLKIPREKLTGLQTSAPATATVSTAVATGLKLKISQGKIKESRKREKAEEERTSPPQGLPSKYHRPNGTTLQVGMDQAGRR